MKTLIRKNEDWFVFKTLLHKSKKYILFDLEGLRFTHPVQVLKETPKNIK